jgi:hypothetical protein
MTPETFLDAYLITALWASTADDGTPLDSLGLEISPETRATMEAECRAFYEAHKHLWEDEMGYGDPQAGHDFWLTRNGHGAGFWDRKIKNGDQLTVLAHKAGGRDLYVGDDNLIYQL